ncbi:MAG: efflux RND transporter permease subunit [Candidatus Omnitrophica bacterium]|nr:efflux RND transporter permease subunit [Candidatus Omnitrophota bacterium]
MEPSESGFIGKVIGAFARSKVTPLIIIFSVVIGLLAVLNLPREEEPQISVPMFDIFVSYPGASTEEVERRVVNVGERRLWEINGVEYIYSMIRPEGAVITVRFKVGEDVERSLIKLYSKVNANLDSLAKGGTQPFIKVRSIDDVPVLALTFHAARLDEVALRKVVSNVQNEVAAIPDVSETLITGGRLRQFRVELDGARLRERILDPAEIALIIQRANVKQAAGKLEGDRDLIFVEADAFFRSKSDLENLVVGVSQGGEVYLKDVARVVDGPDQEDRAVNIRFGVNSPVADKGPFAAATLAVSKRKGTNAAQLCGRILKKVEGLRGGVIPAGVEYTVTRDYGHTAEEKSNELLFHMALAVLGVSVLIGFVLGWREAGVVAVAIPMTLALTLAGFYFMGFTLNRITLFALIFSIGILVDDPIVDVENIVRHLRMAKNRGRDILLVAIDAVNEVQGPLILATLTVIAAILPMAFVSGLMGPYMRPIPIGASLAMLISMMVAFVATPWAACRILGGAHQKGALKEHVDGEREDWLTRLYRWYMKPLIEKPRVRKNFLLAMGGLLFLSILLVPLKAVKVKMLPFDNKNEFQVVLNMPEGTPVQVTARAINEMADYLKTVPEVRDIEAYVGASAPYNFNGLVRHYFLRSSPWQADLQVNLAGKDERKRQSHAIAVAVRPQIHAIAAKYSARVQVAEVPPGPPVLSTLVTEVYGPTEAGRRQLAEDIEKLFRSDNNVTDVDTFNARPEKLYRLRINTRLASLNGVSPGVIAGLVAESLKGNAADVAHLSGENEPVEIVLRLPAEKRQSLDGVLEVAVLSRYGNRIPLRDLVTVEEGFRDPVLYHKNLLRVAYVTGDVQGSLESPVYAILSLKPRIAALVPPGGEQKQVDQLFTAMPEGGERWSVKWDGEWQVTYEVFRDLGIAFAIVLLLIYALVVGWFQSFKTPLIIMFPIPLTLIGILPAHWMTGTFFTATSMIGMIAGAGIVVRNAIILVDFIELRRREGMSLEEAVVDAGAKRFRPMLLTAAAVVVGASVILFDPIFQGLALALIAGEVASTLLSRTAIPVIYYMMMKPKGGAL